ncbi:MAG: GDYXXLXY domain-containing protein [Casimicrobium sp.]
MNTILQRILWIAGLVLSLGAVNYPIVKHESTLRDGAVMRLELVPVDPRSLMQGDYMALRFAIAEASRKDATDASLATGRAIVRTDARGVAQYVRIDRGEPLAQGERRLEVRLRGSDVRIVTNAYFFQEGTAEHFERAKFGEFRVNENGTALLANMLDEKLQLITGKPH